jgi:hypothetical protein
MFGSDPSARVALVGGALALLAAGGPLDAAEWRLGGRVGLELRVFPEDAAFAGQRDTTVSPSVFAEPELAAIAEDGKSRFVLVPFARVDRDDQHRTHVDLREAKLLQIGEGWDLVTGFDRVFWGVTESRHLVDIVNQIDQVEDIDSEDRLGQPMLNLNLLRPFGTFRLFALPWFRERTFPDDQARLRGPLPVRGEDAEYSSGSEQRRVDFAARYSHTLGGLDLGLSYFHGMSREPRFLQRLDGGQPVLVPFYEVIDQASLDAQFTTGPWAWKLESLVRSGQGRRFAAAVGGFEYTLYDVLDSGLDLGLLAEYSWDGRDEDEAPPVALEDDVFLGLRVGFNDRHDSMLLAGATIDRDTRSTYAQLEYSTRLTDQLRLEVEARLFLNVSPDDSLRAVEQDGFVTTRLSWYF